MNIVFKILTYVIIILIIFLLLDFLFKMTIRKRKWKQIYFLANKLSQIKRKPIMIIYDTNNALIEPNKKIQGDIVNIITRLPSNKYILIVSQLLEYVDEPKKVIYHCKRISGDDVYFINIENTSPRIWWDYKIKNIMNAPFYLPYETNIKWINKSNKQKKVHKIYAIIFKILPYRYFTNNSIMK